MRDLGGCLSMNIENNNEKIVIGMPLKNGAKTVGKTVKSVLSQKGVKRNLILLIVNDNSSDNWQDEISEYLKDPRIVVINVNFGKPYAVRNFIIDYVRKNIPDAIYIGRLDADDFLADEYVISQIEHIINRNNSDVIIAGNYQMLNGKIIRLNKADKRLLDSEYLKERLFKMAHGILEAELPSCNVFVKPQLNIRYKNIESAEDHWYLVDILLNKEIYNIYIAEELIYTIYSLDGKVTKNNRKKASYIKSRQGLYRYYLKKGGFNDE